MKYNLLLFKISIICVFISTSLLAQKTEKRIAPNNIKSIQIKPLKVNAYAPIIKLGTFIELSFDDLDGDEKNYTYSVIHCDYNWQPSKIARTEYLNGLTTDNIRTYSNAFNTYQIYTHYNLILPNDKMRFKLSGNYILQVKDDYDEIIFTRRFMVYEPKVSVGVSIHKSRNIDKFNSHQNVQFVVNTTDFNINNPREEIKISLYQNNDWNTVITGLKPQYYSGNQLIYKYADKSLFASGNEYLYFDTKNIRTAVNNIRSVTLEDLYNSYLYVDKERFNKPYTYYPDVDGNFVIRNLESNTAITEADYSWVHFYLDTSFEKDRHIYVYGAFNNWQINKHSELFYNTESQLYETKLLLKQGFYNYKYIQKNDGRIDLNAISGSFYQTENNYAVLVYLKSFGSKYDRLIGVGNANSKNLQN
jgi:type 9 secretion system plug protein